jgi:hypothetical protein
MDPAIWGAHLWYVLHIITMTYPKEPSEYTKRAYHDFFNNLKDVLPCDICKKHYSKFIKEFPITPHLDSRENVVKWLIQIHNFVNLELGKPVMDVETVIAIYSNIKPSSPFDPVIVKQHIEDATLKKNNTIYYLKFAIIVCLFIIIAMKYYYTRNYYVFDR